MLYLILIIIIIVLLVILINKERKIKMISRQVNEVLFQQKDIYIKKYKEGNLSLLETEIAKLTNRLYEQNHILEKDKLLLKQSLEDISHQIKTPLTSLHLIQERLKESEGKEKRQLLKEQQLLYQKIEWLISSLLKLAQLDTNTIQFNQQTITQEKLYQLLIKTFDIQIELKNIQIIFHHDHSSFHNIDISWTLEALSNIVKNSIEHIQPSGQIIIEMNDNPLYSEIIIQDNGKGIDNEDLPHLFERFYKGKNATQKSVGIGLALSHMIVEKQNGTITVDNTYPGVKFTIHFYKEVI